MLADRPDDVVPSITFATLVVGNLALILVNRSWRLTKLLPAEKPAGWLNQERPHLSGVRPLEEVMGLLLSKERLGVFHRVRTARVSVL